MTGDRPMITCVIPAYGNRDLCGRAMLSALSQRGNVEVVVSDDSPDDEVEALVVGLQALYPNLRYVRHASDGRPASNWNFGLDNARGRYAVVLHHDEFFCDPSYLEEAVSCLETHRLNAVVARSHVIGIARSSRFPLVQKWAIRLQAPIWSLLMANWIGSTACVVFRNGPEARFNCDYVNLVDVDLYRRLLAKQKPVFLEGVRVISLGHHGRQISARINPRHQSNADLVRMLYAGDLQGGGTSRLILRLFHKARSWGGPAA